jgi:hypothetical protein
LQDVREKEKFKNGKHDEKLEQNYYPYLFSPIGKISEPFIIKTKNPDNKIPAFH